MPTPALSVFTRLLLLPVLVCPLAAQRAAIPTARHDLAVDSKYRDNRLETPQVVFDTVVQIEDAAWIRLFFDKTNLPLGSRLRLTGLRDKAVQYLDARALFDYGNSTCYFNGDSVRLELLAGRKTKANRVLVVGALTGIGGPLFGQDAICGTKDDRVQSKDKRQGRLSAGCTGWLVSADVVVTAGHCTSLSAEILSFNVPDSSSTGRIAQSHPNDQYPLVMATLKKLYNSAVLGADWAACKVAKNSNTGKLPGTAQGGWYTPGGVPTSTTNEKIRITGYGTTTPANYLNQVQKTDVGPLSVLGATYLGYKTDTTGGNSGSPVIHEGSGKVVGIHTNGGCDLNSAGYSNYGTRIDRKDLQTAIHGLTMTPGQVVTFGSGCKGSNGVPALAVYGSPELGKLVSIAVNNVPSYVPGLMLLSLSNTYYGTIKLPLDLGVIGMTGCSLLVSLNVVHPLLTSVFGQASLSATIPNQTNLIGTFFYVQYVVQDRTANPAQTTTSNGAKLTVGG